MVGRIDGVSCFVNPLEMEKEVDKCFGCCLLSCIACSSIYRNMFIALNILHICRPAMQWWYYPSKYHQGSSERSQMVSIFGKLQWLQRAGALIMLLSAFFTHCCQKGTVDLSTPLYTAKPAAGWWQGTLFSDWCQTIPCHLLAAISFRQVDRGHGHQFP